MKENVIPIIMEENWVLIMEENWVLKVGKVICTKLYVTIYFYFYYFHYYFGC